MKRYVPKNPQVSSAIPQDIKEDVNFDIHELMERSTTVLQREIQNLLMESARGKLSPPSAKSLVDYIKLLHTMEQEQATLLATLTDEQLARLK